MSSVKIVFGDLDWLHCDIKLSMQKLQLGRFDFRQQENVDLILGFGKKLLLKTPIEQADLSF